MHRDQAWYDMATPEELARDAGEHGGRQQVYNALLSWYLDAGPAATTGTYSRDQRQRHMGRGEVLTWAAMITWGLDEQAATERVGDDIQERLIARTD